MEKRTVADKKGGTVATLAGARTTLASSHNGGTIY
jgi:hypothetical protein